MELNRANQKWLDAYSAPHAYLYTFSRCMALADLQGDGDHKLIFADLGTGTSNIKLKVYKGTSLMSESTLLEIPTALVTFYHEQQNQKIPAVALASGSSVYIYKNMKPFYKFSLPELPVNPLEMDLWMQAKNEEINPGVLYSMLDNLKNEIGFSNLSYQSQKLLIVSSQNQEELKNAVTIHCGQALKRQTVATCMATLFKNSNSPESVSCLVVGTENGWVYIVDGEAFTILDSVNQSTDLSTTDQTVPVIIKTMGLYDVEFRIIIYNRNGKVTLLRRGWTEPKTIFQLDIQAVDMCLKSDTGNIILALMDSSLECYTKKANYDAILEDKSLFLPLPLSFLTIGSDEPIHYRPVVKGKKLWNIKLPSHATGLLTIPLLHQGLTLISVALEKGKIFFFNDRELVDSIMVADTVAGMVFGKFGQEEHCLVVITISGVLQVKILKRTAQFNQQTSAAFTTPSNQNIKLNIPKKSNIFLEQVGHEMNHSVQIHQMFQSDVCRFRLDATRAFYDSLNKINNTISNDSRLPLKMSAEVFGLGPTFKIVLTLENMSATRENVDNLVAKSLRVVFHFNNKIYRVETPHLHIPFLVPGLVYKFQTLVRTVAENPVTDEILIFLIDLNEKSPVLSISVHMPVCDVLPIEI